MTIEKCDRGLNVKPADIIHCGRHDAPGLPRHRGSRGEIRRRTGCCANFPLPVAGCRPVALADSKSRPTRSGSVSTAADRSAETPPEHRAGKDAPDPDHRPRRGPYRIHRDKPPDTAPVTRARIPAGWLPAPTRRRHASSDDCAVCASGCRRQKRDFSCTHNRTKHDLHKGEWPKARRILTAQRTMPLSWLQLPLDAGCCHG